MSDVMVSRMIRLMIVGGGDEGTHDTVLEFDDMSMTDSLEDTDLTFEVLEQFRRQLVTRDRFDSDRLFRSLN